MSRVKSYQTAAARRKEDPLVLEIDGVALRCVPVIDIVDLAPIVDAMDRTEVGEGESVKIGKAAEQIKNLRELLARYIVEEDQPAYWLVVKTMSPSEVSGIIKDLMEEYAGAENPTLPKSSSDPS